MSVRPAGDLRINILSRNHFLFIIIMYGALFCHQETGTDLYCFRSQHRSCRKTSAVRNTTRGNYGNTYCIHYLRHQRHRRRLADMPAGFHSFRDHCIRTGTLHHLCKCHTGYYRNHTNSRFLPHSHIFSRISGAGGHHLNTFFHNHLRNGIRFRIHQHYIYAKGFIRQLLRFLHLFAHKVRRCAACTDNTQRARLRCSRRQMVLCDPGHTALQDRILDPQKLCNLCFHSITSTQLKQVSFLHLRHAQRLMPLRLYPSYTLQRRQPL